MVGDIIDFLTHNLISLKQQFILLILRIYAIRHLFGHVIGLNINIVTQPYINLVN
jgi:hypothetical protein